MQAILLPFFQNHFKVKKENIFKLVKIIDTGLHDETYKRMEYNKTQYKSNSAYKKKRSFMLLLAYVLIYSFAIYLYIVIIH